MFKKATVQPIAAAIRWFKARYTGKCGACETLFHDGDQIGYTDEHILVGLECCGGSELVSLPHEAESFTGADFDSFNHGRPPAIRVMPTGKTAKDVCMSCFMIHSVGQGDTCA